MNFPIVMKIFMSGNNSNHFVRMFVILLLISMWVPVSFCFLRISFHFNTNSLIANYFLILSIFIIFMVWASHSAPNIQPFMVQIWIGLFYKNEWKISDMLQLINMCNSVHILMISMWWSKLHHCRLTSW